MTQHYTMLQRNLLYTGVTCGKRLVVLVGQKKAVAIAVRSVSGRRRWSKLREWLQSVTAGRERSMMGGNDALPFQPQPPGPVLFLIKDYPEGSPPVGLPSLTLLGNDPVGREG